MTYSPNYSLVYPDTCEEECSTCYEGSEDPNYIEEAEYCDPCFQETGIRRYDYVRYVGRPTHFCEDVTMAKTLTVAGISTFMSDVFAQMNLEVSLNVLIGGNLTVKENVVVEGNAEIEKGVKVGEETTTKDLTVQSAFVIVGGKKFIVKSVKNLDESDYVLATP